MNIVPMDLVHKYPSDIHKLRDYILYMKDSDNSIGAEFLDLFNSVLDSYDIETVRDNNDIRNFRNYLGKKIDLLHHILREPNALTVEGHQHLLCRYQVELL